jgi:hypothetical protein
MAMKNILGSVILFCISIGFFSCDTDDEEDIHVFVFDFEQSTEGWIGDFSDYPSDWDPANLEFEFAHTNLPEETTLEKKALMLSGRNISDDMFMFLKKQITGLIPNREYQVRIRVRMASQYPEGSVGIGGSPGASVFLKAGGSTIEPEPVEEDGYIAMNIDKGNQAVGGQDAVLIGNVGISGEEFVYTMIERDNFQNPVRVRTDNNGSLWVIVGTDSGFEGISTLYYNKIEVRLR